MRWRRSGFAVVLVVALLAAILLLLVGLVALAQTEARAAGHRSAARQARANALVGMRLALGRLQAAAGPDACATAPAGADGGANRWWTGVWSGPGAPVWLVSGAPAEAAVAVTADGPTANGAWLVGPRSVSVGEDRVAALYETIRDTAVPGLAGEQTVGRFAYWIGDEGLKGNVGVVDRVDELPLGVGDDPIRDPLERARVRQLLAHRGGADALNYGGDPPTGGFLLGPEGDPASAARWAQLGATLTENQLRFHDLGETQATENYRAFLRRHWHELTVRSAGVLANAAEGGLRGNFSDLESARVPAAVRDLERYRPQGGRLPVFAGTVPEGEPTAQVKPVVTEWALDFVPYREEATGRLLVGCRLRMELWNPYNLPLAHSPAGVPDYWVRIGGRRTTGGAADTGLPVLRVGGPGGPAGECDLGALVLPSRPIELDLAGDIPAGEVVVVAAVIATAWDSGVLIDDPTPSLPADDRLRVRIEPDADRRLELSLVWLEPGREAPLTRLTGFPSTAAERTSAAGDWGVTGNDPFAAGSDATGRLGLSYHFRLDPGRASWAEWVAPERETPVDDLRNAVVEFTEVPWRSVGADPVGNARATARQFDTMELFAEGASFAAFDFTVQRNLSIAAAAQIAVPGERMLGLGYPWGGVHNALFDRAFFNPVRAGWAPGERLPNVRHRVLPRADASATTAADLAGFDAARELLVDGMFNVNSTSEVAWAVVLGRTVRDWRSADGAEVDLENPFFHFGHSAEFAPASARGVRRFSDAAIQLFATELAQRVGGRPRPFRSLAEFVDSGVVQDAIAAAGLNTRAEFCADLGGVPPAPHSANYLTQAAVLNTLAPVLAVRSDTFTIRVAAEALNAALEPGDPDRVAARAWCEATVQRLPEFVDPADDAATWPATVAENVALGRRFRIVAFRWLGPDDI